MRITTQEYIDIKIGDTIVLNGKYHKAGTKLVVHQQAIPSDLSVHENINSCCWLNDRTFYPVEVYRPGGNTPSEWHYYYDEIERVIKESTENSWIRIWEI